MSATAFRYRRPDVPEDRDKVIVDVARTGLLSAMVHVVTRGGETNLHAHNGEDGLWYVLSGQAAFYDDEGKKRVLGRGDAVLLPSGTKYWFESLGDEPLEILRIGARDPRVERTRTDVTDRPRRPGTTPHVQAEHIEAVPA